MIPRDTLLLLSFLFALMAIGCKDAAPSSGEPALVADTTAQPIQDGTQEIHTNDGGRMLGEVAGGKRNGEWSSYFPNGTIRSRATFVDGVREGPTKVYHENGLLYYSGQYHRDKQVGEWLFFDAQGAQVKVVRYDSLGTLLEQH
jgi:hypothetical protein